MQSVSAIGRIATRIRQTYFDPNNIETQLYASKHLTPLYTRKIQPATWCQIAWTNIPGECEGRGGFYFPINGPNKAWNRMDYLLAFALRTIFPIVKVAPTKAPKRFKFSFATILSGCACEDFVNENCENQLYYHVSDGLCGHPDDTLYIGSAEALNVAGLTPIHELKELFSRHKVSWGKNAVLGNIERVGFNVDVQTYENKTRHAIYNDLQYRMREDVFPKGGEWATSLPACEVEACHDKAVELLPCEDDRRRTFINPFSFTTSAFADRGENGKFKTAFPVMMACTNNVGVQVNTICDPRDLLVLREEILKDFGCSKLRFVALADSTELNVNGQQVPQNSLTFSNGCNFWNIPADQFLPGVGTSPSVYMTAATLTFTHGSCGNVTKQDVRVGDLKLGNIATTCRFRTLTRQGKGDCANRCVDKICWDDWICNEKLCIGLEGRVLGASCTDYERGMMKADVRTKKWLFEKYSYLPGSCDVCPGACVTFDLDNISGQYKFSYVVCENVDSLLQGQNFNYTNDTDFCAVKDQYSGNFLYRFDGKNALRAFSVKMQDEEDTCSEVEDWITSDTVLFAQRLPRETCALIAPRYSDFINCIQPGGSVNMQAIGKSTITVDTARSGEYAEFGRPDYGCKNTFGYNIQPIAVSWNLVIFKLQRQC